MKIAFKQEQINIIIEQYKSGKSCKEIGRFFDCSKQTINRLLVANNVQIRNSSHCQQKCSIDEDIFNQIDSNEKAYWLGILSGDGCIHNNHISLSMIDEEHIYNFRNFMKSSHNIRKVEGSYIKKDGTHSILYSIDIWNQKIANDLKKYNLCNNKTQNLTFPNIDAQYINSFILGLIDSDGWIHINHKLKYPMIFVGFVGTYDMVHNVMNNLMINCKLKELKIQSTKSQYVFTISYGGNKQALRILKYLYASPTSFLYRKKYAAILFLMKQYPNDEWLQNQYKTLADEPKHICS